MKKSIYSIPVLAAVLAGASACTETDTYTNLPPLSLETSVEVTSYESATVYGTLQYPAFYKVVHLSYWEYEHEADSTVVTEMVAGEQAGQFTVSLSELTSETQYVCHFAVDCIDGTRHYTEPVEFATPTDLAAIQFGPYMVELFEGAEPYKLTDDMTVFNAAIDGKAQEDPYSFLFRRADDTFAPETPLYWRPGQTANITVAPVPLYAEPPYYPYTVLVNDDLIYYDAIIGTKEFKYPERAEMTLTGRLAYIRLTVNSNLDGNSGVVIETTGKEPGMALSATFGLDGTFTDFKYGQGWCAREDYRNYKSIEPHAKNQQVMYAALPQKFADGVAQFRIVAYSSDFTANLPIPAGAWESHRVHDYAIDIVSEEEVILSIDDVAIIAWKNGGIEEIKPNL